MSGISKRESGAWQNTSYGIRATAMDTITTLPTTIYGDGANATVGIKGNTVQSDTPTPDSPIMPQGCGEKTAQLYFKKIVGSSIGADGGILGNASFNCYVAKVEANQQYIGTGYVYAFYTSEPTLGSVSYNGQRTASPVANGFTSPIDGYVVVRHNDDVTDAMLNSGSTALPYEPYGYKITISSANTTTPVYLGEVETTRKIRKLVLTGAEEYMPYAGGTGVGIRLTVDDMRIPSSVAQRVDGYCTHFLPATTPSGAIGDNITFGTSSNIIYMILSVASQQALNVSNFDEFKAWISAQYAAETPVCVWYVLATEETAVVNEPLMKIDGYADEVNNISIPTTDGANTLSVDTTVQPSEVNINYHGWHMGTVHERTSGQWD